jgi:DNA-binding NarL/FixJ family response regulator
MEGAIRVVLADDHAAVRRCLRRVLDGEENIEVIAEAQDFDSLMREMHAQPGVLALTLTLSDASGIETLRQVRKHAPDSEIVVLAMHDDPSLAQHILEAGATGFVLKDMASTDLPTAVRDAAAGQRYVSPSIATRLAQRVDLS